jgi:hypothetical protein
MLGGVMFQRVSLNGISRKSLNSAMAAWVTCLTLSIALAACSKGTAVDSCIYLDAFEREVAPEHLTGSQGSADALKMLSQGRIVFLGGYLQTGPITLPLTEYESEFPSQELDMDKIIDKFGLNKLEKVYLTKRLNEIKSREFIRTDDGTINGHQVDRGCYTESVREYAVNYNRAVMSELLKRK